MDMEWRLYVLSYNDLKQSQINTLFPTQKEMDRVGFEPTTSAMPPTFYLQVDEEGKSIVSIPPSPDIR